MTLGRARTVAWRTALVSALLLGASPVVGCTSGDSLGATHAFEGATMGTRYRVRVDNVPLGDRAADVESSIQQRLSEIDRSMSTYRDDSEVSRLNRHPAGEPFALSAETFAVLRRAREISRQTTGAFDVTVGGLVDAWGFGPADRPPMPPDEETLARLRDDVGYVLLELDPDARTATKLRSGVTVDLSAIAKGYAVDAVVELLRAEGFADVMVEIGGELRTSGRNRDGEAWRIGIERPGAGATAVQRVVGLTDMAMATSGDYRNYYELAGRRIAHGIDPRSGLPIEHAGASVTVIADSCMDADALSTALMILGPEEGLRWAAERRVAALFVVHDGSEYAERASLEFERIAGAASAARES